MRRITALVSIMLVLALLVGGCAGKSTYDKAISVRESAPSSVIVEQQSGRSGDGGQSYSGGSDTERMIISTVKLAIVVDDTDATLTALRTVVQAHEGYISDSTQWLSGDQPYARVTVRVPAQTLNATLDAVRGLALRVQSESISGQDVTEEYINLDARIQYLEATQTELLALLKEVRESGGTAEDILSVYDKVMQVGQEIESLKGRQQYLSTMTAMATISIEIQPKATPVSAGGDVDWSPAVTLSHAWRSLVTTLKAVIDILIYVVLFLAIPVALICLLIWLIRRRKRGQNAPTK